MKSKSEFVVVMVTAPDLKTGRQLARTVLAARLAACVNLMPRIESHYWWQEKLETSPEVLLVIKTTAARLNHLEKLVLEKHPYDTPEFIALPIARGNKRYLDWIRNSVA